MPGADTSSYYNRRDYDWDRIQILYILDRLKLLTPSTRLLIIAGGPDPLIAVAADHCARLDAVPAPITATAGPLVPWPDHPERISWLAATQLVTGPNHAHPPYPAVVVLRNHIQDNGRAGLAAAIRNLDPWVEAGGVLILALDVALVGNTEPPIMTGGDFSSGTWILEIAKQTGYMAENPIVSTLDPTTLDCLSTGPLDFTLPLFLRPRNEAIVARAVITLRKAK